MLVIGLLHDCLAHFECMVRIVADVNVQDLNLSLETDAHLPVRLKWVSLAAGGDILISIKHHTHRARLLARCQCHQNSKGRTS